jgi:hypothetical protein
MKVLSISIVLLIVVSLAGCFVRTGPTYQPRRGGGGGRACPPAYHWDGYNCVHNGNGRHRGN